MLLSYKIKTNVRKTCKRFCQRIDKSAGRGSGTEGGLSYTWLVSFQCSAALGRVRHGLNVVKVMFDKWISRHDTCIAVQNTTKVNARVVRHLKFVDRIIHYVHVCIISLIVLMLRRVSITCSKDVTSCYRRTSVLLIWWLQWRELIW